MLTFLVKLNSDTYHILVHNMIVSPINKMIGDPHLKIVIYLINTYIQLYFLEMYSIMELI